MVTCYNIYWFIVLQGDTSGAVLLDVSVYMRSTNVMER